jgi:hypothetical protein
VCGLRFGIELGGQCCHAQQVVHWQLKWWPVTVLLLFFLKLLV